MICNDSGKQVDDLVESGKFSGQSNIVETALTEFFIREEQHEHEKKMEKLYSVLINNYRGIELLNEVPRTAKEKAGALTKAGIAHVEAGEYEEAKRCFARAKQLESGQPANPPRGKITYASKKEREEECLEEICPEPRKLTILFYFMASIYIDDPVISD
jgi:Arc/MetJ-type ribon-helix-helix transcriptional regulator